jgi:sugar-specific transcriptional regulator TrmB
MSIQSTLKAIGLNDKEIKVYLTLLKNGKTSPATLAKLTGINRATMYNITKSLNSMGVIAEDLTGKSVFFTPLPPASLKQTIERQRRELDDKEKLVTKAIGELSLLTPDKTYPVPTIRFIEEDGIEDFLYESSEKWQDSGIEIDGVCWGFQDHTFTEYYEEWIHWTWKIYQDKKYKVQLFSNTSSIENKLKDKYVESRRDIKFLKNTNFTSTVFVSGDYLTMVITRQHPHYLFEIHDKTLAHNMREVFKKLWEKA